MSKTSTENRSIKALQEVIKANKNFNSDIQLEYDLSICSTTKNGNISYTQKMTIAKYNRIGDSRGYTKCTHLHNHQGGKFNYIVIKRFKINGGILEGKNQIIEEIRCWLKYQLTPEADYLCPILKYYMTRSDKVADTSEKAKEGCVIIAQKAEAVGECIKMCKLAEEYNRRDGYRVTEASVRYAQLEAFAENNNWWDVMENDGNSGVIFDYASRCWKAVFIDYAL